jgi:hypothetical protein
MSIAVVFENHATSEHNEQGLASGWSLEHVIDGIPLEHLVVAPFSWRPGWEYLLLETPRGSA